MSIITANNSLLEYEARTKSHSRHMRNYQKVSETNLDDTSIISYLKSRHLTKTLTTFLMQSNSKKSVEPILDIFLRGGKNYEGSVQQYWQKIKDAASKNNQNLTGKKIQDKKTKLIKLELYIYIWYCISDKELNSARLNILKQFIQSKGQTLSEIPELLAYFALPYVDKKIGNPIIKRIYSEEWSGEVRTLLEQLIGVESDSMQQEWFNIIVDMIQICEELIKNISVESSAHSVKSMVERVTLYKTVVEKNRIQLLNQLPKLENAILSADKKEIDINMNNVKQIKGALAQLDGKDNNQSTISMMIAYNKLQQQILHRSQFKTDKKFVHDLIDNDILLLKNKQNLLFMEYQWLKLLKIMTTYHKCRNYLVQNKHVVKNVNEVIQRSFLDKNAKYRLQMLLVCFGILQRVMVRQQLFEQINKNDKVYEIAVSLIKKHEFDFQKSNVNINMFEATLGCIFGAVMHRKGRTKISKTILFEILVNILKRLPNMDNIVGIQLLICSTIYLLLVQQHIRSSAIRLHLKDVLLNRMTNKKSGSYDTYVQYIIERIERNDEEEEIDSDQDTQKDEEFDHDIAISDEVIIICKKHEKPLIQDREGESNKPAQNENQNLAANIQDGYARDRYSWKKKWLKQ